MSLKHVDLESALRRLAERRIEDAMREGKFDNLAGSGKPLDLEPMPADENARMTWWMLRILKNNNFTPEEVTLRRKIESLKHELSAATTEHRVDVLVKTVNELVRQLNTLGTNAINIAVTGVSLEEELRRLRERTGTSAAVKLPPPGVGPVPADAAPPRGETEPASHPTKPPRPRYRPQPVAHVECGTALCKTRNPATARFCRRCGKVLPAA